MSFKKITSKQKKMIKVVFEMLNDGINNNVSINAYQLSKRCFLPYNTVRNNLTKIINL